MDCFESHHLAVADTYWRTSPTYWRPRGQTSSIDHIVIPHSAIAGVECLTTLMRAIRALQLVADARPRDHSPIMIKIRGARVTPAAAMP